MKIDAVAGNLIANHAELKRMVGTFAQHGNADRGSFGTLEKVGHVGGGHVIGGLAIDSGDDIAGADAGSISRRAHKRRDDDDFIVAGPTVMPTP